MKKILLVAVLSLVMASTAFARECPQESLQIIYQSADGVAGTYTCDNNRRNWYVSLPQGATEADLVKVITGKTIEELAGTAGESCVFLNRGQADEVRICQ